MIYVFRVLPQVIQKFLNVTSSKSLSLYCGDRRVALCSVVRQQAVLFLIRVFFFPWQRVHITLRRKILWRFYHTSVVEKT